MVGKDNRPMVTTVAPTMPVRRRRNAPTTTVTANHPEDRRKRGSWWSANRQQFWTVQRAHEDEHRNGKQRSIDCPARTRSFIRFTTNDRLRSIAVSQPPINTASPIQG
jgi:hypothetical protein